MQRMAEPGSFQEIEQPFHDAERRVPTQCSQHVANVRASNLKELEPVPPIRLAWATESGLSILPRRRDVFRARRFRDRPIVPCKPSPSHHSATSPTHPLFERDLR